MKQLTEQQVVILVEALNLAMERTEYYIGMAKFLQISDAYEKQDQNLHKFQQLLRELTGE